MYGNVFGLEKYKDGGTRYTNFTTRDNHKLQTLQNRVNRILLSSNYRTPTTELLRRTNSLSVQQMIAFQTLLMTFKILQTSKPSLLSEEDKI